MKYGGEPHTPFYTGRKNYEKNLVLRKEGRGKDKGVIFEYYLLPCYPRESAREGSNP
jgi:hypothetical protein